MPVFKHILYLILIVLPLGSTSARGPVRPVSTSTNEILRQLDKILQKEALYTQQKEKEIDQLKAVVRQMDEHAFVIVGDANEVIGKGFQDMQEKY